MLKFSVAMSVYKNDNPYYFDRALESITDLQTVKPDEICLVVDGPVSNAINSVIDKYASKYTINVIRSDSNKGLGNALRVATENAKNDFIARMDSDDVSIPTRFEQQILFLQKNPDCDVVGGDISEFVDSEENIVAYRRVPMCDKDIKDYMKTRCAFNHVSVMIRKDELLAAGGYLDCHYNEDYYLWIRMQLRNATFGNTGTTLVNVRTGLDMYARRGGFKYYKSEKSLQKLMLKSKMINYNTFVVNCFKRFVVQVLLPREIRGYIFRKYARSV